MISFNDAVNFEAPSDADGDNTFEFFVSVDGESGSGGTHTATITDANDAPVDAPATASGDKDTVISGALGASDEDGDTLTFSVATGPSHGTVAINADGSFQFTPVADFN